MAPVMLFADPGTSEAVPETTRFVSEMAKVEAELRKVAAPHSQLVSGSLSRRSEEQPEKTREEALRHPMELRAPLGLHCD